MWSVYLPSFAYKKSTIHVGQVIPVPWISNNTQNVTSPDEDRPDSIPDFDRTGRMFAEFLAVRDQKRFQSFVENAVKVRGSKSSRHSHGSHGAYSVYLLRYINGGFLLW